MVMRTPLIIILIFLSIFSTVVNAKVSATVDRNVVEEGETFQLNIQSDDGEPEIDVLKRDFTILGTSTSSKVSIINGSINSVKELILSLVPKAVGTFVIPPIRVGNEATAPIRIQVNKPSFTTPQQGADIFLEAKADLQTAYVQSQIVYTVRLFRAVEIREGSLTEPNLSDAVVERLGEDVTFQTRRDGRLYQVTERRFAIFPQKSGSFSIAPTVFQGQVLDNRGARQRSNDPFDRFFQNQRTKRVRVKSEALELMINPQPADAKGEAWLPAKRLILTETWSPESPEFKVGEPVTRTLRMEAHGLTAAQLPELKPFEANGIKQYADQPRVETVTQQGKLVGIREEKFAIVPTQSGKLVLPELRLYWWDTEMNQQELITIPPKIIEVAPAAVANTNTPQVVAPQPEATESPVTAVSTKEVVKTVVDPGYWPFIALAAIAVWLITSLGWLIHWHKIRGKSKDVDLAARSQDSVTIKEAMKQLKKACENNDASDARQALIFWAQAAWPELKVTSLNGIAKELQDSTLNQSLSELNKVLYASDEISWDGNKFWSVINPRLKTPRSQGNNEVKSLPELYPQH